MTRVWMTLDGLSSRFRSYARSLRSISSRKKLRAKIIRDSLLDTIVDRLKPLEHWGSRALAVPDSGTNEGLESGNS